jgi:hypothetical protein
VPSCTEVLKLVAQSRDEVIAADAIANSVIAAQKADQSGVRHATRKADADLGEISDPRNGQRDRRIASREARAPVAGEFAPRAGRQERLQFELETF